MQPNLPRLSEDDITNALLTGSDEKLHALIVEKMSDTISFSLRTSHERMLECAIFCIFFMSKNELLFKSLKTLSLDSIIDKPFTLDLDRIKKHQCASGSSFFDTKKQMINNPICFGSDYTTLLHLLYWRDTALDKIPVYSSILFVLSEMSSKPRAMWDMAFKISIENKDICLIKELYNINEYALMLNGTTYLKSAIEADFYEAVKWLYSIRIKVSFEENPFELLEKNDLTLKERAIAMIMESDLENLLPSLRCKEDMSKLVRLRDVDPVEAIALADNKKELEALLGL